MLRYQPKPGAVVKCNFQGYILPEIVKCRPAVIIHVHKSNPKLVTVIPISSTLPTRIDFYHHELDLTVETNLTPYLQPMRRWFKCDLLYVVSIDRMDRFKHRQTGKRDTPHVSDRTLRTVKEMARLSNGL